MHRESSILVVLTVRAPQVVTVRVSATVVAMRAQRVLSSARRLPHKEELWSALSPVLCMRPIRFTRPL